MSSNIPSHSHWARDQIFKVIPGSKMIWLHKINKSPQLVVIVLHGCSCETDDNTTIVSFKLSKIQGSVRLWILSSRDNVSL